LTQQLSYKTCEAIDYECGSAFLTNIGYI